MSDEMGSGSLDIMMALWIMNRNKVESTYNQLFNLTTKFHAMAKQTFNNRLKKLIEEGYVEKSTKEESKLHFTPSIYKLTKNGVDFFSLSSAKVGYKQKQEEESNEMTIEEIYRRLYKMTLLAASSVPLFIFLGHENFINNYIFDMANTWIEIIKKRMHANMEEAIDNVLPLALALTVAIGGEPLSESMIEDISIVVRQHNIDPEEVFNKSKKMVDELKELMSYL